MNIVAMIRREAGLTQQELAAIGGTSQPAIAAYESGSKVPSWRTLERLADATGLEMDVRVLPGLTREDRRSLAIHGQIAERLEAEPHTVIGKARRNIAHMKSESPGALPLLREWEEVLSRSADEIAAVLRSPLPHHREMRQVTPFAGVLDATTRSKTIREFQLNEATR